MDIQSNDARITYNYMVRLYLLSHFSVPTLILHCAGHTINILAPTASTKDAAHWGGIFLQTPLVNIAS
jgi:hypothetical protein